MKNLNTTTRRLIMGATLLFAGLFASIDSIAQKPTATVSNAGVLQLPAGTVVSAYQFDLAEFGFDTQEEAMTYFSGKSFTDFTIRPNLEKGKATVILNLANHPGWSVSQWNSMLLSATSLQPLTN